jgi:hypothetical protein
MAIKVFWHKTVKTIIEVVSIIYFIVGAFVFFGQFNASALGSSSVNKNQSRVLFLSKNSRK